MIYENPTVVNRSYPQKGKDSLFAGSSAKQLAIWSVALHNRSGAAIDMGVFVKRANADWKIFTLDGSGTPDGVEVTAAIQAGTATLLASADNDGILIQSTVPFGMFGMNVSTAEAGGTPAWTVEYWNGAYVTLTNVETGFPASGVVAASSQYLIFPAPHDWIPGCDAADVVDQTLYTVKIIATTVGTTNGPSIDEAWVGEALTIREGIADNGTLNVTYLDNTPKVLEATQTILPYFGTANAANIAESSYSHL